MPVIYYAVQTDPQRERGVHIELIDKGYDAWLPVERYFSKVHEKIVDRPLFPGYLFAGFDPELRMAAGEELIAPMRRARGVRALLPPNRDPIPIKARLIEELRQAEGTGLFDKLPNTRLKAGDEVRMPAGPFAGIIGKIKDATSSAKRLCVLYEILGREVEVSVRMGAIERV